MPETPFEIVRADGHSLYDAAGVGYLDVDNGSRPIGAAHPRVVEAISGQATAPPAHTRYLDRRVAEFSKDLLSTFPSELTEVLFTSSGSEAHDLALKIARSATGSTGVILLRCTILGVDAEPSSPIDGRAALPGWMRVVDHPADGADVIASVTAVARELRDSGHGLAGLIVDPGFLVGGASAGLGAAVAAVRAEGGLVIVDESQSGFGRTGLGLWGFESMSFTPDIVTVGTSLGNGVPVAAVVVRAEPLERFPSAAAYRGDPATIAVAQTVLNLIRDDKLVANAKAMGDYLQMGLALLGSAHEALGRTRGSGLLLGVDIVAGDGSPDPERALAIVDELQRRLVIVGRAGRDGHVLTLRPALSFTVADADRVLEQLYGALLATDSADQGGPQERGDVVDLLAGDAVADAPVLAHEQLGVGR